MTDQTENKPGGFWNGLARVLVSVALWAAEHPQVVQGVVDAVEKR